MNRIRTFSTIKEAMAYRMRHGITQVKLGELTGLHYRTIAEVVHGHFDCTTKTLAKLGVIRKSVYLVDPHLDAGQGHSMHPHRNTRPTPQQKAERLEQLEREKIERQKARILKRQQPAPELTNERIVVAVRAKLNPLTTWQTFTKTRPKGNIDVTWQAYCAELGQQPTFKAPAKTAVPVSAAPVLYGHLRPVDRGVDHRRPLSRGELPRTVPHYQPEVTQGVIREQGQG